MQPSSAPPPVAESDGVALQINLLALNLALQLARMAGSERSAAWPELTACDLSELLEDDVEQIGAGEGLKRAVEELQQALRQADELALRSPVAARAAGSEEPEYAEVSGH
jgi:hypothetical protein